MNITIKSYLLFIIYSFMPLTQEFPLDNHIVYLNHAGVAPWPRRTAQAVQNFATENMNYGARHYLRWEQQEHLLREQLCTLLNAPNTYDIALLKNTSEALSIVAYGIRWQNGDNIVITNQEFPSNRIVWESLQNQGVTVRQADISDTTDPEAALFAQTDAHTRLIAVSSVQYATGLRMDLTKIGEFCQHEQILFGVDAIQSLGALAFDVQTCGADFVMADGHKWMLGPEGLAVFYCKAERRELLELKQFGWHNVDQPYCYDAKTWRIASDARRFECGSPNMLGIHGLSASLSLLLEVGMTTVETHVLDNTRYLFQRLSQLSGVQVLTPQMTGRYAGIVTFRPRHGDVEELFCYLQQQGIICAKRGGGIRFSPHFYTPRQSLEQAINCLKEYLGIPREEKA